MTTNQTISLDLDPHPHFADRYAVTWVEAAKIENECAAITFEAEVWNHRKGQKIFIGLLDKDLKTGVGLAIDTEGGEVIDMINDQGILGYLSEAPLAEGGPLSLRFSIDKFGTTHICSAEICGERILYPAVLLDDSYEIGAVIGSTLCKGHAITVENAVLKISDGMTTEAA
jgi:hypothetical protein